MGFEFKDLSPTDRDLIEQMIESSWFRDWRQVPDYEAIRQETGYPEQ
jgi:hypothetical protein